MLLFDSRNSFGTGRLDGKHIMIYYHYVDHDQVPDEVCSSSIYTMQCSREALVNC